MSNSMTRASAVRAPVGDGDDSVLSISLASLASIGLHAVLAFAVILVPLAEWFAADDPEARDRPLPVERKIRFTFKPVALRETDGNATPRPAPPTVNPMDPEPTANLGRVPLEAAVVPSPSTFSPPPNPEQSPLASRVATGDELPRATVETEPATRADRAATRDLEPRPPEASTADRRTALPTPPSRTPPTFDLGRALREFDGAVRDAQATRPRSGGKPTNVFRPDALDLPTQGFGVGELTFTSADFDWSDYGRQVYIAIWREWHRQMFYGTDEFERFAHRRQRWLMEDWNRLEFTIVRDGGVARVQLLRESELEPHDDATVRTLEGVVLPPLPAAFPRAEETVKARFLIYGDIRTMRRHLDAMRRRGYFSAGSTLEDLPETVAPSR